jgi:hypothetical protein
LIDLYIQKNQGSINFIGKNRSPEINCHIKSYFYRGLELYADRDYANALTMFKKSIEQIEAAITARATSGRQKRNMF